MGAAFGKGTLQGVLGVFGLGGLIKQDDIVNKNDLNAVKEAFAQAKAQLTARYNNLAGEISDAQKKLIERQLQLQELMLQEQVAANSETIEVNSFVSQALVFLVLLLFLFMFVSL